MKIKNILIVSTLIIIALSAISCGKKDKNIATPADAITDVASSGVAATSTPSPSPTSTPSPTPTPTFTIEESWTYSIKQQGFYNAAAEWDKDGNLVAKPNYEEIKDGDYLYFNDCDEYYDNFVHKDNVMGEAEISLSDEITHSSDNSIKITNRSPHSNCFSGFNLLMDDVNVLNIDDVAGKDATVGFWIYYQDDLNCGVKDELTFVLWSNMQKGNKEVPIGFDDSEYKVPEITDDSTDSEKQKANDIIKERDKAKKEFEDNLQKTLDTAGKKGYEPVNYFSITKNRWTYIQFPVKLSKELNKDSSGNALSDDIKRGLAISTIGEELSTRVNFYTPFYLDDIEIIYSAPEEDTKE